MNSIVKIHLGPDGRIDKVEDRWNDKLPDGAVSEVSRPASSSVPLPSTPDAAASGRENGLSLSSYVTWMWSAVGGTAWAVFCNVAWWRPFLVRESRIGFPSYKPNELTIFTRPSGNSTRRPCPTLSRSPRQRRKTRRCKQRGTAKSKILRRSYSSLSRFQGQKLYYSIFQFAAPPSSRSIMMLSRTTLSQIMPIR